RVSLRHALGAEYGASRARDEARLYEEGQDVRLCDGLAVEPLDREPLPARAPRVLDERCQSGTQPCLGWIEQREQRPPATLHKEGRLAAQEAAVGAGDGGGWPVCPLRPRQRGAVRLRGIRGSEHERSRLHVVARPELAQPLDRATERELGPAEPLDEVSTAA